MIESISTVSGFVKLKAVACIPIYQGRVLRRVYSGRSRVKAVKKTARTQFRRAHDLSGIFCEQLPSLTVKPNENSEN
jgi:hypothetical protein